MLPDMKQVWQNNLRRLVSGLPDKKQGWQTRNESANQTCFETGSFEMNLPDQFLVFLELQGLHTDPEETGGWLNCLLPVLMAFLYKNLY